MKKDDRRKKYRCLKQYMVRFKMKKERKKNWKKKYRYLERHIGDILRCDAWKEARPVRLKGITPEGCMMVEDIISGELRILSEDYMNCTWRFG